MIHQRTPGSGHLMKTRNLSAVLRFLLREGIASRVRLSRVTGLSPTTITNLVTDLIDADVVAETEPPVGAARRRGVGRPRVALRLVPEARCAVGVHIGVGSLRVAVGNLLGEPLAVRVAAHPVEQHPDAVVTLIVSLVNAVIADAGIDSACIVGVGVGASGLVDPSSGVNVLAPNLGWRDFPLGERLAALVPYPIRVDNNVRAMALGEALFGLGQAVRSLAFVYARVGVGAGIAVDDELYYGGGAGAGEIGHMIIEPHNGAPCRCGSTGCLETLVAEPVILRLAEALTGEPLRIADVFARARAGDAAMQDMLAQRARYMGIALANLVNILNPELIVLGGIFAEGADLLLPTVQATIRARAFAGLGDAVRLETASFGADAGVVGAAALALNAFFYRATERVI